MDLQYITYKDLKLVLDETDKLVGILDEDFYTLTTFVNRYGIPQYIGFERSDYNEFIQRSKRPDN